MRPVLLALSLLIACASVALVAQMRYIPDAPGRWKPWTFTAYGDTRTLLGARPADVKGLEAQLLRLNEIIKGTGGITHPMGFSVETSGSLSLASGRSEPIPGEPALTVRPLPAVLYFGAFPIVEYGSGATARREDGGETALLAFFVNEVSQPCSRPATAACRSSRSSTSTSCASPGPSPMCSACRATAAIRS